MAYRTRYLAAGLIVSDPVYVGPPTDDDRPAAIKAAVVRRRHDRLRANTVGARHSYLAIAERDGWRCHLCGGHVDPATPRTDPMGGTSDHLIPVAHGGGDEAANVRLAHRRCNIKRRTGGVAQLMLVG